MNLELYKRSLRDPRWRALRDRRLEIDKHTCQDCLGASPDLFLPSGRKIGGRLHVHHIRYPSALAYEADVQTDLVTLCEGCHTFVHFNLQGRRRTPEEWCLAEWIRSNFPTAWGEDFLIYDITTHWDMNTLRVILNDWQANVADPEWRSQIFRDLGTLAQEIYDGTHELRQDGLLLSGDIEFMVGTGLGEDPEISKDDGIIAPSYNRWVKVCEMLDKAEQEDEAPPI